MSGQPVPFDPADEIATDRPLTPDEALVKLFLDNADHGRNAANDVLIAALLERARAIQALAEPLGRGRQ